MLSRLTFSSFCLMVMSVSPLLLYVVYVVVCVCVVVLYYDDVCGWCGVGVM